MFKPQDLLECNFDTALSFIKSSLKRKELILQHPKKTEITTLGKYSISNGYFYIISFSDNNNKNEWFLIQAKECLAKAIYVNGEFIHNGNLPDKSGIVKLIEASEKDPKSNKVFDGLIISSNRPHHFIFDQLIHIEKIKDYKILESIKFDKDSFIKFDNFDTADINKLYLRLNLGENDFNTPPKNILSHVSNNTSKEKLPTIKSHKKIKLWIGTSGIKRSWIEQINGYTEIILRLAKNHDEVEVLVDGMTSFNGQKRIDQSEQKIYFQIQEIIKEHNVNVTLKSLIGKDYREKINSAKDIDFYISMDGAGLIVPLYFLRKPGVTHGTHVLNNYSKIYSKSNIYVDRSYVTAIKKDNKNSAQTSYSIPWEAIYNCLVDLNIFEKKLPIPEKQTTLTFLNFDLLKPYQSADILREVALKFEIIKDYDTAKKIMDLALEQRPTGKFIYKKCQEYKKIVDSK